MLVHPAGFPQISLQLSGSAQATRSTVEIFYDSFIGGPMGTRSGIICQKVVIFFLVVTDLYSSSK